MFLLCSYTAPVPQPLPESAPAPTLADAAAVARGIGRLFARNDIWCLPEMPLRNGRRADLMGIDAKGHVIIVEIEVARAALRRQVLAGDPQLVRGVS